MTAPDQPDAIWESQAGESQAGESQAEAIQAGDLLRRGAVLALTVPILGYRYLLSPVLPPACRFLPSCSDYALEALRVHGPVTGLWLTARRLARCHPLGGWGIDPVPPRQPTDGTATDGTASRGTPGTGIDAALD